VALYVATRNEHHNTQLALAVDAAVIPSATPIDSASAAPVATDIADAGVLLPPLVPGPHVHHRTPRPVPSSTE
ncbi:MAG: hypothetical protein ABI461_02920, partial [Polyangiaceae bacterium]